MMNPELSRIEGLPVESVSPNNAQRGCFGNLKKKETSNTFICRKSTHIGVYPIHGFFVSIMDMNAPASKDLCWLHF